VTVPKYANPVALLAVAALYVTACLIPSEPSDARRVVFTFDFEQPYRVPLAGVAQPSIQIAADGQVLQGPNYRLESLDPSLVRVDPTGRGLEGIARGTATVRVIYATANGSPDTTFGVQVVVSRVAVASPQVALTRLGDTVRLAASAFDANDALVSDVSFTWTSADPGVASVSPVGLVTARNDGEAMVAAEADGVSDSAPVTVVQAATQVRIAPRLDTLRTVGRSTRFLAVAFDDMGEVLRTAKPRWSSSNESVARVDTAGLATGTGGGTARIIARVGTAADTATLAVVQVVRFLVVTPGFDTLTAIADTARVSALAFDSLNFQIPEPPVAWATSDPAVATVDQAGLVQAAKNGVALVTASAGGQSAFTTVVVRQEVAAARIVEDSVALTGAGTTAQLSAVGFDRNDFVVDGAVLIWRSRNPLVATVDAAGLVTAWGGGTAGITATPVNGGQSDTVTVTVTGAPQLAVIAFDGHGIEVMGADGSGRRVLIGDGGEPTWSPDGARLAFTRGCGRGIYTVSADGSDERRVTDGAQCDYNPAWSPDGTQIAFSRFFPFDEYYWDRYYIYVVHADGSNLEVLFGSGYEWDLNPTWSPDGAKLAFEGYPGWGDIGGIYVINADCSGCSTGLNLKVYSGYGPAWSPDGSQLAYHTEQAHSNGTLRLVNPDGEDGRDLGVGWASSPAWSPDGAQIVFVVACDTCNGDLYIINRDGTGLRQLTSTPDIDESNPAWRPLPPPQASAQGARP